MDVPMPAARFLTQKMRYLSHFRLFIIAGFRDENGQPARTVISSSNLMILKKIKK
jgi:hypothetical protein